MNNITPYSKRLAYLLRHSDLPDRKGWVKVDVLVEELKISLRELQQIIDEDTKGRFEFSCDRLSTRALYGHSMDVDLELEPETPPAILYHGTADKYLSGIMKDGLKSRSRNFVHLSETTDMAMQVGTRHGEPVILIIDALAMMNNGEYFYKAQNGVWLTKQVPIQYIKEYSYE